jgi:hypothetical protein
MVNIGLVNSGRNPMKSVLTKIHALNFLCARCQHWQTMLGLRSAYVANSAPWLIWGKEVVDKIFTPVIDKRLTKSEGSFT